MPEIEPRRQATNNEQRITNNELLRESLDRGYTLPAEWYTDPAIFDLEKRRIFGRSWQYAGLTEQVASPGDFLTLRMGDVPIIVLRDDPGKLRAFINVCRHRGSELVPVEPGGGSETAGRKKSIQCHYHAWTYNLDGTLRAAPGSTLEPDFDPTELSLLPAPVETWGPFIFVNPGAAGEGGYKTTPLLERILGELPTLVADIGIDLGALRRRVVRTYEVGANWKVVVDNYLECYHCPVAHKSFSDLIDVANYQVAEHEYFTVQTARIKDSARRGKAVRFNSDGVVDTGLYAFLWPSFTINIYPGPGNVSLNRFIPLDVDRTRAVFEYLFVESVTDEDIQEFDRFIGQVQGEDTVLCESVQRGLRSGHFRQGKLMLNRESALRHFQRLVHSALTD